MKCLPNGEVFCCAFFLAILLPLTVSSQKLKSAEWSVKKDNVPIVDITDAVLKQCTESLTKRIDDAILKICFRKEIERQAMMVLDMAEASFRKTRSFLAPLKTPDLKIYLYKKSKDHPQSYRFKERTVDSAGDLAFPVVLAYTDESELNSDCTKFNEICDVIYGTIPHEIAHISLLYLQSGWPRWFEEGVAEYANFLVAQRFAPALAQARDNTIFPELSLNRDEIRRRIFSWRRDSGERKENIAAYYGAAAQIIRLVFSKSTERGYSGSCNMLFSRLRNARPGNRKRLTEQVRSIIKDLFQVDIFELGPIDESRKLALFESAVSVLKSEAPAETEIYGAVMTLACIDDIPLESSLYLRLLSETRKFSNTTFLPEAAATALIRRQFEPQFNLALQTFVHTQPDVKYSTKELIDYLERLSFRPAKKR